MIGVVVVSHSRPLAQAAVDLAAQMVGPDGPRVAVAAGLDDGSFGTDAAAISLAIAEVDSPDGVLVLIDLGSALLSSELAIEFLDDDVASRVRLSPAPLVEGLMAAVVQAAAGSDLATVEREARGALAGKTGHIDDEDEPPAMLEVPRAQRASSSRQPVWRTTVRNPHGIHVRPAAAIVTTLKGLAADVLLSNATTGRGPAPADSLTQLASLELQAGHVMEARFSGPDADRARDALAELASRDFGEDLRRTPRQPAASTSIGHRARGPLDVGDLPPAADRRAVVGVINRGTTRPSTAGYRPLSPKDELTRFTSALGEVDRFLADLAATAPTTSGIIDAQRMMLADRELQHGIVGRITAGFSAVDAIEAQLTALARSFDQFSDPYLRERGQDLRSLRRLLLLAMMDQPLADQGPGGPCIWLLDELDAATAVRLDPRVCMGVITLMGGSSGHGMLAAQGRGIPVLTGFPDADRFPDGQLVAFDPVTRELWPDPDQDLRDELDRRNEARSTSAVHAQHHAHEPAVTRAGVRIQVEANVSSVEDAVTGAREGAEGSGVVRTEVLFANRADAPSVEEQAEVFVQIGEALDGPVTIRAWDPAADKPLPFLHQAPEDNPALGSRGIRAMRHHPELFANQLRAILIASRTIEARLLLPMVTSPDEVLWARQVLDRVRLEVAGPPMPVGVMIEVPAAAIRAADFAPIVDFVSMGTNDLSQYTQAADRTNAAVRELARQDAPAVLDLVAMTCRALPAIPIAVCGDLASDPSATQTLIGLGVRELSVRPRMVAEIKQAVRLV